MSKSSSILISFSEKLCTDCSSSLLSLSINERRTELLTIGELLGPAAEVLGIENLGELLDFGLIKTRSGLSIGVGSTAVVCNLIENRGKLGLFRSQQKRHVLSLKTFISSI